MLLLEPLWRPEGRWTALLAHLPADQLPSFQAARAASPLAPLPCYWVAPDDAQAQALATANGLRLARPDTTSPQRLQAEDALILCGQASPSAPSHVPAPDILLCGPWISAPPAQAMANPAQPILLELLSLIVGDADTPALEKTLAKSPPLTISLLRLVNSVALGARQPTTSLRQAITVLGRRQLQRWLQLLLYAEQYGPSTALPPLFTAAALRAKRLESWSGAGWPAGLSPDAGFLCGMLSLLDRLFAQPLAELLAPLPLPPMMLDGLLAGHGDIGKALTCLALCERGDAALLAQQLPARLRDPSRWMAGEIDAVAWAYALQSEGAP